MSDSAWRLAVHGVLFGGRPSPEALEQLSAQGYAGLVLQLDGASLDSFQPPTNVRVTGLAFAPEDENPCPPERAAELAEAAGAEYLRVCGARMAGQSYQQAFDATLRTCETYSAAARRYGIRVLLHQRWGTVTASASQLQHVLSQFDPTLVGCVYDAGSMTVEGYEEYRIGLEILGGYVGDVHIANARHFPPTRPGRRVWEWEWSPLSDGLLDLQRLFRALRRSFYPSYQGWITLADRSEGRSVAALLEHDRQVLEQAMADVEGVGSHNPCRPLDDHVDLAERPERFAGAVAQV